MAEILGLGGSHGPMILTSPEAWARGTESVDVRESHTQLAFQVAAVWE